MTRYFGILYGYLSLNQIVHAEIDDGYALIAGPRLALADSHPPDNDVD
jgi:hypothetical protein